MQSKKIISGLDVMKFIMALFIVNIHLKPTMYAPEVVQHVVGTLSGLAVPLFFVISSFLLFRKVNIGGGTQSEWQTIVKFSKRLLLLYGFWCIAWSPIVYLQKDYLHDFTPLSILLLVRDFFFGSIFDASWFLGALLVGVPLVCLLVKALGKRLFWIVPFMVYLYIIYADDLPVEYQVLNHWYTENVCEDGMWLSFPSGLIWISIGYLLSTNKAVETFSKWNNRLVWLASLASIGLIFCKVPLVNILAVILLFISAYTWHLPEHPALYRRLRTYSILFYVIHDCFKKIPKQLFGMENGPVLFVITIAFCFFASEFIIRMKEVKGFGWLRYAY